MVAAAFPYIQVTINTAGMLPVAQRSPGVIAVVGVSTTGAAPANTPIVVADANDAATNFASRDANGVVIPTPLYSSLALAFEQDPQPSKVYGVKVAADGYPAGLVALEGVDDVTLISLANVTALGVAATDTTAPTSLLALKDHIERLSAAGSRRIGVAMIDPTIVRAPTYAATVATQYAPLQSSDGRMILLAARGATQDVATAAMAAIAGYAPAVSILLKPIADVTMPLVSQYSATEIKALSEANINPIIDPTLIDGDGLYFGEGRTFSSDPTRLFVDTVRLLDDIEFRLKAALISLIGDARITKSGLVRLKTRIESVLEPLEDQDILAGFDIAIPVLDIVSRAESTWSAGDTATVTAARANRAVDVQVSVTYGPAVHRLNVTLAMGF
jgi:hypothetical protein